MYIAKQYRHIAKGEMCSVLVNIFIVQGEYEEWEDYRKACSTLEGDQEFVQLWEKLLSNTKVCMM